MRRRLHIDNLRTSDPVTLEVLVGDALRRPLSQLDPRTVTDLMALSEVEALPRGLRNDIEKFSARMAREIRDLPDSGEAGIPGLCEDLLALPAGRVPACLRQTLTEESEREGRAEVSRKRLAGVLESVSETEPEEVGIGRIQAKIVRAAAPPPPKVVRGKVRGGRGEPAARRTRASGEAAPKKAQPDNKLNLPGRTLVDEARQAWLSEQILERLGNSNSGLKEIVLLAGLTHRARAEFPDLRKSEIKVVLEQMEANGLLSHSAGRWSRKLRGW